MQQHKNDTRSQLQARFLTRYKWLEVDKCIGQLCGHKHMALWDLEGTKLVSLQHCIALQAGPCARKCEE